MIFLKHVHGGGVHACSFQKTAKLRDFLSGQFLGMRLMEHVPVFTDREQHSAVRLLARCTEPVAKMQRVRPGDVVLGRMAENRLERAPIPMEDSVMCGQLNLRCPAVPPDHSSLRVIRSMIKRAT